MASNAPLPPGRLPLAADQAARHDSTEKPRSYIRYEIVDFNGKALSKTVPARHRDKAVYMYSGALAMGANSEVLVFPEEVASAGCPNIRMVPDWSTEQVLPWAARPGVEVRRVYCEQAWADGRKQEALPRTVCARLLKELHAFGGRGLELFAGGELEFTVAEKSSEGKWSPLFQGVDIFATLQNSKMEDYFYELEACMEPVGVDILTYNAEYGAGQLEVTFAPKLGLEAADAACTFREGAKELAQRRGVRASFCSKPFGTTGVGNGGHFNFSLWAPGDPGDDPAGPLPDRAPGGAGPSPPRLRSALHSASDPGGLSETARHFLAGVLAHAPAMEALCAPTPCCYTRHGNWAPTVANWAPDDRSACVRVKADPKGDEGSCYMELRLPSASASAHLVMAAVVAAGLDGLSRQLPLPPAGQTKEDGAAVLPTCLEDALAALEADAYMVERLGPALVRWYGLVKRGELAWLEARRERDGDGPEELSAAWQDMYMEFV